jgi:hypothetical protein
MLEFTSFYLEHQLQKEGLEPLPWLECIQSAFVLESCLPGYREGVKLLPVDLNKSGVRIKHRTHTLSPGDVIDTKFESRVTGESPRKKTSISLPVDQLADAPYAFVVLYHRDVLAEDGVEIASPWGVVAHLTACEPTPEPMHPDTLLANHYGLDGGTHTLMDAVEFEQALGISVHYWKDKVLASPLYPTETLGVL